MSDVWSEVAAADGVRLLTTGEGPPVVVFPGLEGSGESCLHLVLPVVTPPEGARGQVWLLDYEHHEHEHLGALVATMAALLDRTLPPGVPVTLWGQSFGSALLALVAQHRVREVSRSVLVSPFARLSPVRLRAARVVLAPVPTSLYRATAAGFGRLVFGPVGDGAASPFFASLQRGTAGALRRHLRWLQAADFSVAFTDLPGELHVWFGDEDRLVDRPHEFALFRALARGPGSSVTVLPRCGHVVLPSETVVLARAQIADVLDGGPAGLSPGPAR